MEGGSSEEDAASAARAAYARRTSQTYRNIEAGKTTERAPSNEPPKPPDLEHALGVIATKDLGGQVPQKFVTEAEKTLKKHGYARRPDGVVYVGEEKPKEKPTKSKKKSTPKSTSSRPVGTIETPDSKKADEKDDAHDKYMSEHPEIFGKPTKPPLRTTGEIGSTDVEVSAWMPDRGRTRIAVTSPGHQGMRQFDVSDGKIYNAGGGPLGTRDLNFVTRNKDALLKLANIKYGDNPKKQMKY